MLKNSKIIKRRGEHGSTMLEALFSFLLLMIIFLGFMQIFKMSAVRMLCDYSSYCAARARALGYRHYIIERAARIPLMPVSGQAILDSSSNSFASSPYQRQSVGRFGSSNYSDIYAQAQQYMMYGPLIVDYSYWDSENEHNSTGTEQNITLGLKGNAGDGYAQDLVDISSGFNNYPSGFEFLDSQRGKRMTLSVTHSNKYTTTDDDFTYDTTRTPSVMQNYSRYIITENYWSGI